MRPSPAHTVILALLIGLAGCDSVGGGRDYVVNGDGNTVVAEPTVDRLAAELAGFATTPEVTDAELADLYQSIRRRAAEGDLQASLVVLKIAAIQRQPADAE